jgi:hypothetical protein
LYAGYDVLNAALVARSEASLSVLMNRCGPPTAPLTAVSKREKVTNESIAIESSEVQTCATISIENREANVLSRTSNRSGWKVRRPQKNIDKGLP